MIISITPPPPPPPPTADSSITETAYLTLNKNVLELLMGRKGHENLKFYIGIDSFLLSVLLFFFFKRKRTYQWPILLSDLKTVTRAHILSVRSGNPEDFFSIASKF